jgi:hypothetical protein
VRELITAESKPPLRGNQNIPSLRNNCEAGYINLRWRGFLFMIEPNKL